MAGTGADGVEGHVGACMKNLSAFKPKTHDLPQNPSSGSLMSVDEAVNANETKLKQSKAK